MYCEDMIHINVDSENSCRLNTSTKLNCSSFREILGIERLRSALMFHNINIEWKTSYKFRGKNFINTKMQSIKI